MPTYSIDPLYPHWLRCDLCGKDVAEVLPAEPLDLGNLTAGQVLDLCPDAEAEIDGHEHQCLRRESYPVRALQLPNGNLLVPVDRGLADHTGEDPFREIGPDHPEYGHWLALSTPGEDPRVQKRILTPRMLESMQILKLAITELKELTAQEMQERPGRKDNEE